MNTKGNIAYYVQVGSNGIGYETRCNNLEDAKALYNWRKQTTEYEITLYKYDFNTGKRTTINHRRAK